MGIHGLSSFIQEHGTLGKQCVWTASSEPSCFIIDGNAYVYHYALSCKTDWVYGGNYSLMAELVRSHTKALRQANITPIFLFDGALPEDKKTTRVKRYKNYIDKVASVDSNIRQISKSNQDSVSPEDSLQYWGEFYLIPPLTLEVVVQTLRELEVQVIICRDEADGDVVTMAQEKNAYVVSKDSDMYVYPHAGMGYLPLDLLSIGTQVQATVYQPHVLAGFLKLSPFILPLLGTLLGNDYFDIQVVRYPIMEWCTSHGFTLKSQSSAQWPKYVAEFLRTVTEKIALDNVVRVVVETLTPILLDSSMHQRQERADRLENDIIHSICRYDTASPLIQPVPVSATSELPALLHTGEFSRQILDCLATQTFWSVIFLEDINRASSCDVSRTLRRCLYSLVHLHLDGSPPLITEHIREKDRLGSMGIAGMTLQQLSVLTNTSLSTVKTQLHSDLQVRQDLFLALHHTSRKQLNSSTHSVLQPVILCLRHFIFQSHTTCYQPLNNHEVMGLLIASLCSLGHLLGYTWKDLPNILSKPKLVKHSLHLAAQWQGVIYASHLLSQLLCHRNEHLETPHILASFFNGVYVHAALQASRSGDSLAILLANASPHFRDMVCHTWALVTDGLENAILPVFDYKLPRLGQGSVPESYWIESGNLKKKAKSLEDPKRQKVMKKVAKKSVSPHKNSKNAFDVLSFGCSFDD